MRSILLPGFVRNKINIVIFFMTFAFSFNGYASSVDMYGIQRMNIKVTASPNTAHWIWQPATEKFSAGDIPTDFSFGKMVITLDNPVSEYLAPPLAVAFTEPRSDTQAKGVMTLASSGDLQTLNVYISQTANLPGSPLVCRTEEGETVCPLTSASRLDNRTFSVPLVIESGQSASAGRYTAKVNGYLWSE